jgi:hypothetical protein
MMGDGDDRNESPGSAVFRNGRGVTANPVPAAPIGNIRESQMTSETQIHTIARQMLERHGGGAIADAARNALACERKGEAEEAREWRHIEDAMKMMRGPHQS